MREYNEEKSVCSRDGSDEGRKGRFFMREMNQNERVRGGYGVLCRGRYPCTVAELKGSADYPMTRGRVELYATPAGVVVSARLWGLPQGAVMRMCLMKGEGGAESPVCFPLLYERGGEAWFTQLTEKLTPAERGEICLTVTDAREKRDAVMAWGILRSRRARCG